MIHTCENKTKKVSEHSGAGPGTRTPWKIIYFFHPGVSLHKCQWQAVYLEQEQKEGQMYILGSIPDVFLVLFVCGVATYLGLVAFATVDNKYNEMITKRKIDLTNDNQCVRLKPRIK